MGTRRVVYRVLKPEARLRLIYRILSRIGSYGRLTKNISIFLRSEITGIPEQIQDQIQDQIQGQILRLVLAPDWS